MQDARDADAFAASGLTESRASAIARPIFLGVNRTIAALIAHLPLASLLFKFSSRILPVVETQVRGVRIKTILPLHQRATYDAVRLWERREPETLDWLDAIESGSVLFDIGASFGNESLYAALKKGGPRIIICWDIELEGSYDLAYNIILNDISNIENHFSAVSDKTGTFKIFELSNYYCVSGRPKFDFISTFVRSTTIDTFVTERGLVPNYIKIDVDGAEAAIVRGMKTTLRDPALRSVLVEINSPAAQAEIEAIMSEAGFRLVQRGSGNPDNFIYRRSAT